MHQLRTPGHLTHEAHDQPTTGRLHEGHSKTEKYPNVPDSPMHPTAIAYSCTPVSHPDVVQCKQPTLRAMRLIDRLITYLLTYLCTVVHVLHQPRYGFVLCNVMRDIETSTRDTTIKHSCGLKEFPRWLTIAPALC